MHTEPYLLAPTMGSMAVCWLTSEPDKTSYVEYGRSESYGCVTAAVEYQIAGMKGQDEAGRLTDKAVYQYIASVCGLEAGTCYFYRGVRETAAGRQIGPGYHFRTAPEPGDPIRFLILSDVQVMRPALDTLKLAGQQGADFIIYNGDLVSTPSRAEEWFGAADRLHWFDMMQQTGAGCNLLQYIPIFPCPGNHEIDDQECLTDKRQSSRDHMSISIYLQLFRPLYPDAESGPDGVHWYSADYGDLHLISLSVFRWASWWADEYPGWLIFDSVKAGSRQYEWLKADLVRRTSRYVWISHHWHMFNRGKDTQYAYTDPVPSAGESSLVEYPADRDYLRRDLKPLYERHGVNAVSFGHSHVYERYLIDGVHYIEAASVSNCYRGADDPPDPSGFAPVVEQNGFRSFMLVSIDEGGMVAKGVQASVGADGVGFVGRIFDEFVITAYM